MYQILTACETALSDNEFVKTPKRSETEMRDLIIILTSPFAAFI